MSTPPAGVQPAEPAGKQRPAAPAFRSPPWLWAWVLIVAALITLYGGALRTGFLNDDYLFLEQARLAPFPASLWAPDPLGNYFRPLSRGVYFGVLHPLIGASAFGYHIANFGLFLLALWLIADLLLAFAPPWGALAGVCYFALLHGQRVILTWVSCSQDLLALAGALAAVALFRRGRMTGAALCYAVAAFSKESSLPLPGFLILWGRWREGRPWPDAVKRVSGMAAVAAAWLVAALLWHRTHPAAGSWLRPGVSQAFAAYAHMAQSVVFLEQPLHALENLLAHPPPWLPLLLLLSLGRWFPARDGSARAETARHDLRFAGAWALLAGVPIIPVVHTWSAYYFTFAAVGGALLVAILAARADRWTWTAMAAGMLWLHAGACGVRAFAVVDRPWVWTSHLTPYYFQRGAAYVKRLSREMKALEPSPPRGSRLFFATLPSYAGFQSGNGALLRAVYGDATLRSYFYTQFSESTAGHAPCDFFYWDGSRIRRLYPASAGRFTQVAGDLLLQDRIAGARHALVRAFEAGEDAREAYYWLGWIELILHHRDGAEEAWRRMGARDSALAFWRAMDRGDRALARGDTAAAHRAYLEAVPYGIGRPEAHRRLGALLFDREPKYALLELAVTLQVDPGDRAARRLLALGLLRLGLFEPVRVEIARLWAEDPTLRGDAELQALWNVTDKALAPRVDVIQIPPGEDPKRIEGG